MGRKSKITYDMRLQKARKSFDNYFTSCLGYTEYNTLYKFGTDRDREILKLAYKLAKSSFTNGYILSKTLDEELRLAEGECENNG